MKRKGEGERERVGCRRGFSLLLLGYLLLGSVGRGLRELGTLWPSNFLRDSQYDVRVMLVGEHSIRFPSGPTDAAKFEQPRVPAAVFRSLKGREQVLLYELHYRLTFFEGYH